MSDQSCHKYHCCCAGIAQTVGCRCLHGSRINFFCNPTVIKIHIQFYKNRNNEDHNHHYGKLCFFRMNDLYNRIPDQFIRHQKDCCRNDQSRYIFDPSVAKRMLRVRFCSCQLKSYQRNAVTAIEWLIVPAKNLPQKSRIFKKIPTIPQRIPYSCLIFPLSSFSLIKNFERNVIMSDPPVSDLIQCLFPNTSI